MDISNEIQNILEEYSEHARKVLEEASDKTAKETVSKLKAASPKKTGKYAKAWSSKKVHGLFSKGNIVYVKAPHYRLTHLLEYGHAKKNGGRVQGKRFVAPIEQEANRMFIQEVERNI
ncbi:hypothetical protein HMPREF9630_00559 [Peptoanaerobacter stomatis]|uniref:Bacteriophage protein, PF04883 family n=1 Tax=Peptoanaerobacter stomatis TaxID=796937 RepID=V9HVB8_9FIRM|nr:HK97 gp10 family phage protein [Peptoanaerobacter stomatis]EHL17392.1 hypothetical protein HMPREF9630_00559 [Peptoanaerobacter stomatis]